MALSFHRSGTMSPIRNSKMPISKSDTMNFRLKNLKNYKTKGLMPLDSPKRKDPSKKSCSSKTNSKFNYKKHKNRPKTSPNPSSTIEQKSCCKTSQKNSTISSRCTKRNGAKTRENATFSCKPNAKSDNTLQNCKKSSKNQAQIEAKSKK